MKKISILIPVKDEQDSLEVLFDRLIPVIIKMPLEAELVFINDGSKDSTLQKLLEYKRKVECIKIIDFSRNFGKEAAVCAGFKFATGDCAVTIDSDLQDPPELILDMIDKWQEGFEIVTAVRESRETDSFLKRLTSKMFYILMGKISDTIITPDAGDFRLLDRKAIDAFLQLPERARFNKGLFSWLGFREYFVYHARELRAAGITKWNYIKLFKFSLDGIFSFSSFPLRIWTWIGLTTTLLAVLYEVYVILNKIFLFTGKDVSGYSSLISIILFFMGLNMVGLGIIGEYVGRIFEESKQRPLYIIRDVYDKN